MPVSKDEFMILSRSGVSRWRTDLKKRWWAEYLVCTWRSWGFVPFSQEFQSQSCCNLTSGLLFQSLWLFVLVAEWYEFEILCSVWSDTFLFGKKTQTHCTCWWRWAQVLVERGMGPFSICREQDSSVVQVPVNNVREEQLSCCICLSIKISKHLPILCSVQGAWFCATVFQPSDTLSLQKFNCWVLFPWVSLFSINSFKF